ncbi:MAG: DUF882 domain-containing protein [Steroidobacteraceae bacterium]
MSCTRRRLLHLGTMAGATLGIPWARAALAGAAATPPTSDVKRIALLNVHTGERVDAEFFRQGRYVVDSLAAIESLLRDFRTGERRAIDPGLLDYLLAAAARCAAEPVFTVISGYRSSRTNEQLRVPGSGVARHSLHIEGRAVDVRLAGVECATLASRARDLGRGGVGDYRSSDFVHLDTGSPRSWTG